MQEECAKPLEELATWLNRLARDNEVSEAYLSMFINAKVHVNITEAQASHQLSGALRLASVAVSVALASAMAVAAPLYLDAYRWRAIDQPKNSGSA